MKVNREELSNALLCLFAVATASVAGSAGNIPEREPKWYGSDEAVRIADNVLLYQRTTGGWPANVDMSRELTEEQKSKVRTAKDKADSTLDNGATHTHLRYLARVYNATKQERFKEAFLKGLDYLLKAQYANGGWPQTYPSLRGYSKFITFNDGAMIGAMTVLRDIAENKASYAFVDENRRQRAGRAVQEGIQCTLKCQIVVDGRRTAWCQQHDDKTFQPRPARAFEPAAITACESVGIVEFLMSIDNPLQEIIDAVQNAAAWFDNVKITGIRQVSKPDESQERGFDKVVVPDATAPPIWARLYEIGTNRPIFGDRDGKVYSAMSQISAERRTGYSWYGDWPANMLRKDYPRWREKWVRQ
jgi:PelA/Pel-15E family pectate lyase